MNYENKAGVYARWESWDQFSVDKNDKKKEKKSFEKKIVINFFMMFFHAGVLSFEKQKMAHKAHVYKLILVFWGKEN